MTIPTDFPGSGPSNYQNTQQVSQNLLGSGVAGNKEIASPSQSQFKDDPAENRYQSKVTQEDSEMWRQAIRKYYIELEKGGIKGPALDKDLWYISTPMDLINQIKAHESSHSLVSNSWFVSLKLSSRLETVLLSLNDFAAVTAWAMGMSGKVGALLWGSIRLILKLAQPVIPEVVVILEKLHQTLPKFCSPEKELPRSKALEGALSDMYTEIIVFCAYAITFFWNNPSLNIKRCVWSQFNHQFLLINEDLKLQSSRVDKEVDMIRMRREAMAGQKIEVMKILRATDDEVKLPCHMIPYGLNPRFFCRDREVDMVRKILDPVQGHERLRVMSIHGLGGVGKSQIALHYANTSMKMFDVIAWIPSETQIKFNQAFSELAKKLGLPKGDTSEDDYQAGLEVKDWLNQSGRRFLLIFDDVEQIHLLLHVWPSSEKGSILITTRSPSVASKRATEVMHLESFSTDKALEALRSLTGLEPNKHEDSAAANDICRLLGGLPLAIVQMSDYIRDRGCSYEEFFRTYRNFASKILEKGETPMEYNHTLSTVWDASLRNLPQDAGILLNFAAFFNPDKIEEHLLKNPKAHHTDDRLEFFIDEIECDSPLIPNLLFVTADIMQVWRSGEPAYKIVICKSFLSQQVSIRSSVGSSCCFQSPTETR